MENIIGWIIIGIIVLGVIIGFCVKIYSATKIVKEQAKTNEGKHQIVGWIIIFVVALIIGAILHYLLKYYQK